jgi:hypothetical protein
MSGAALSPPRDDDAAAEFTPCAGGAWGGPRPFVRTDRGWRIGSWSWKELLVAGHRIPGEHQPSCTVAAEPDQAPS